MFTHSRRRLALALTLAGTVAGCAFAGPVMAAGDAGSPAQAGGVRTSSIIAVL